MLASEELWERFAYCLLCSRETQEGAIGTRFSIWKLQEGEIVEEHVVGAKSRWWGRRAEGPTGQAIAWTSQQVWFRC